MIRMGMHEMKKPAEAGFFLSAAKAQPFISAMMLANQALP